MGTKRMVPIVLVPALWVAAGCVASKPANIAPATVSTLAYENADCSRLAQEDARLAAELGPHIWHQNNQRTADVAGILVWGVSPSGLGMREHRDAIARIKGERDAIAAVKAAKGCSEPPAAVDEGMPAEERERRLREEREFRPGNVRS